MQRELAEELLAKTMAWSHEKKASELAILQAFADYKYDEYQQYAPGLKFLGSLAVWLRQFKTKKERRAAYNFLCKRLVFFSESEITHLIELAFPMFVRPHLIERAAKELKLPSYRVRSITEHKVYKSHLRRTLVLGLSDGARTDRFRRANWRDINNEQIWHAYDISSLKAREMKKKLKEDLEKMDCRTPAGTKNAGPFFETLVLLDDFTASGDSYLREDGNGGWTGKIPRLLELFKDNRNSGWTGKIHRLLELFKDNRNGLGQLMCPSDLKVIVILYVAAPRAIEYLNEKIKQLGYGRDAIELRPVQLLIDEQLKPRKDVGILGLVENDAYWNESADDEYPKHRECSFRHGYEDCLLPVVLSHNTPNNSIFLLWAGNHKCEDDASKVRGLFPRISRHRASR